MLFLVLLSWVWQPGTTFLQMCIERLALSPVPQQFVKKEFSAWVEQMKHLYYIVRGLYIEYIYCRFVLPVTECILCLVTKDITQILKTSFRYFYCMIWLSVSNTADQNTQVHNIGIPPKHNLFCNRCHNVVLSGSEVVRVDPCALSSICWTTQNSIFPLP